MSFVRYCKLVILGILGRLATPVKNDSINLLKTLMFPCMQKINCIPNFVLEISQRYYKFFWVLETGLAKHIKTVKKVVSTCRKFRCLSACKKSTSLLTIFLRHCKDIAQLLFSVLQTCLAAPIRYDCTNFLNTLKFISTKFNFIFYFFLKILRRFFKLVISSTLGKTSDTHQY